jgi:bifunctional DNA-binding transcriptional regulator/antitoxin component of YhaV-PrlF toxin-antitoxin module
MRCHYLNDILYAAITTEADMASRVSERGQITIDRAARSQLGIRPGMVAYQRVVGGHLEVIFLPEPHCRSLYGVFHQESEQPQAITADELEEAVMEAIAAEQEQAQDDHA